MDVLFQVSDSSGGYFSLEFRTVFLKIFYDSNTSFIECTRKMLNQMEFINDHFGMEKKLLNQAHVRSIHIDDNMFHSSPCFIGIPLKIGSE